MNYKQAVEAALQGNADAFSALYESTQNNMYYLALKYMKNPDRKQDIQDYVTVIYAYRGEESRFYELYSTYPKVIDKFKLMRPIVEKYEIANGIK